MLDRVVYYRDLCYLRNNSFGQYHTDFNLHIDRDKSSADDKSMNKGLISEDRSNKATLLLTILCSLLSRLQRIYRSQYLRLKSVWRWAEAYCCACDRESGNNHRDLAWIPA